MKAELITTPDNDLKVVNAARVSFAKESTEFTYRRDTPKGSDEGLLHYLAKNHHWTPFSHVRETFFLSVSLPFHKLSYTDIAGMVWQGTTKIRHSLWGWANLLRKPDVLDAHDKQAIEAMLWYLYPESMYAMGFESKSPPRQALIRLHESQRETETNPDFIDATMRETIPIFIARQRFKHMVGFAYNEVSRRYVDDTPVFHVPDEWRARPDASIKQGSGGRLSSEVHGHMESLHDDTCKDSRDIYQMMLEAGVAPEQARMELPQSLLTSYYVTAPLSAWARAYKQRIDGHAQKEIQDLANQWNEILTQAHGLIWEDLVSQ